MPAFEILYEEGPVLAVCKSAGILTQAARGIESLERELKAFLLRRDQAAGDIYLVPVHRIDRPVSGALLFARHVRAAKRLGHQFEKRQVRKIYWACVEGHVDPPAGTWVDWMRKVPGEPRAEPVDEHHPDALQAVLHYRVLATGDERSWLEIELETGRTHQIRLQASGRGHHVLGDTQYGSTAAFGPQHDDVRLRPIALHARSITFRHPNSGRFVQLTAPCPDYWRELPLGDENNTRAGGVETWPQQNIGSRV